MRWYRELIAQAGFGNPAVGLAVGLPLACGLLAALIGLQVTSVFALAIAVGFLTLTTLLEALKVRAGRRTKVIVSVWPEVVESIQSAFQSGMTVSKAFEDLADFGPKNLRSSFAAVVEGLNRGYELGDCLNWLKLELATEPSDRTIECLRLLDQLGGHTSIEVLGELAQSLRKQQAFENELEAKQGWVVTTAKLGLLAPWAIVALLSRRPENLVVYNSNAGFVALLGGLAVCLLAYFMIQVIGAKVQIRRVFADAH